MPTKTGTPKRVTVRSANPQAAEIVKDDSVVEHIEKKEAPIEGIENTPPREEALGKNKNIK